MLWVPKGNWRCCECVKSCHSGHTNDRIGVQSGIVHQPDSGIIGFGGCVGLSSSDGAKGEEHCWVNGVALLGQWRGIVQEGPNNALDEGGGLGVE